MMLAPAEVDRLVRLRLPLLVYANGLLGLNKGIASVEDLMNSAHKDIHELSVALVGRPDIVKRYIDENPARLAQEDLSVVSSWVHCKAGRFVAFRHLKGHTVLLSDERPIVAYGIVGITDPLELMLPSLPTYVEAVLLPFEGKLTYDGTFLSYNVSVGPNMRLDLEAIYQAARARYGIVTSLPFKGEVRPDADVARLRSLLRSERTIQENEEEIRRLIAKDRSLLALYHRTLNKNLAREHSRRLRESGAAGGWYAAFDGVVVAGGTSREDVERTVAALVPEGSRDLAHIFHAKGGAVARVEPDDGSGGQLPSSSGA